MAATLNISYQGFCEAAVRLRPTTAPTHAPRPVMNHVPSDYKPSVEAEAAPAEPIAVTMENVHELSTFQLRQACKERGIELEATGALQDFMIKSLVSQMVAETRQKEKEAFEKMQAEQEVQKARMLEEKEARKAEAKERSRLRREAQEAAEAKFKAEQAAKAEEVQPEPEPEQPEEAAGEEGEDPEEEVVREKPEMTEAYRNWFQKLARVRAARPKAVQDKAAAAGTDAKRQENFEQADATADGMLDLVEYIEYTKLEYAHFSQCTGHRGAYDRKMMLMHREGFLCHPKSGEGEKITWEDIGLANEWQLELATEMQG